MALCVSGSGTGTGMLPMKSHSARGIFDPNVEASTSPTNRDDRQTLRRNLGSMEVGAMTRASVVQRPENSVSGHRLRRAVAVFGFGAA